MKLLALTCRHCSAPIQVPDDARFVTCTHCGTQLAVEHTGSAAYTRTLDELDRRTERIEERVDDLHRRSGVAELDREWELERENYYITGKHGSRSLPTKGGSIVGGAVIAVFGALWTAIACGFGGAVAGDAPGPFKFVGVLFPLFGLVFIAGGIWQAFHSYGKAGAYEAAQARYRRRREELLREERGDG